MKDELVGLSIFANEYCSFKPPEWIEIDGVLRPITFKVVTEGSQSLGLRCNPNILTFALGNWVRLSDDEIIAGNDDSGGIWSALRLSGAKKLSDYMMNKYEVVTRIFQAALDKPLYANSYRVKSQGVMLLNEVQYK